MTSAAIKNTNRFHPLKFGLWLGIASIIMLFAALTSAYIVRKAQGNWTDFRMPGVFWFNTAVIILSCITFQWAVNAFRNFRETAYKIALSITLVLGLIFLWDNTLAAGPRGSWYLHYRQSFRFICLRDLRSACRSIYLAAWSLC
jgi:heme/copper-type cytochrome/quinol oxidase subunit 3